ncbi:hypothetical protein DNH61_02465 [Paenibacillus sambharensis]|uniref:Uncharacterized protein n=1 Tax=Paenibacillus sambharensis TaxID=1803190 RepID=A0A2W1LNA2_9BACL|nr:hypothetical protein [Paenibacillus sambharensis]PZD92887.1 hypothetical protein DNH61_25660 [Paenibacillus sambharensis]PZD97454.1 hypothetical protein DNH61_02465 [Paenibacillus sambharensis]
MDFELFLESNVSCRSLADLIKITIVNLLNEKVSIQNDEEEIVIGTEYFSLALELEDISDINFVRTHYDLDVNVCIRVQLFGNTFEQGIKYLFKVIEQLLKQCGGNLLFLDNGSDQLLRKKDGQLIVNSDLNQYQIKYLTPSLLGLLGHSYIKEKLKK